MWWMLRQGWPGSCSVSQALWTWDDPLALASEMMRLQAGPPPLTLFKLCLSTEPLPLISEFFFFFWHLEIPFVWFHAQLCITNIWSYFVQMFSAVWNDWQVSMCVCSSSLTKGLSGFLRIPNLVALIRPSFRKWQTDAAGHPPVADHGCLGGPQSFGLVIYWSSARATST